jgi:O-antigen/teichoic acid export membrane protein
MILQANYFFQAIEKNIFLAVSVLVSRVITLLLIIISVKGPEDVLLSASILSFGFFFSGLLSFFYVLYNLGWPYLPKMQNSVRLIFEGRHLFTGNASVALFRSANVLILAIVANDAAVASYSLAEKYVKSGQALTRPLNQFFVPKAIAAWQSLNGEEKIPKNAYSLIWQKTKYQFFSLNLLIPLFVLAIAILSGGWGDFIQSSSFFIFIVMVPSIYFGVLNAMFGAVGLNMLGHQAYFAKAVFITGVVSFGICIGASYYFEAYGAAFSYVLAEMILFYLFYRNYHNS